VAGQRDLERGTRSQIEGSDYKYETFAHPIAFNLIPQIGSLKQQGYTSEEMKMVYETRKIIGDESIQVCPTCVRVPVSNCHSESILVETERKLTVAEARELFTAMPGVVVIDDLAAKQYPMPLNCDDRDEVFIGRIREDLSSPNGLAFWCVSDNLRKGAATNAVQIAELLVRGKAEGKRQKAERVGAG
jgi:aspartate-semialdehyde dehydrogenase